MADIRWTYGEYTEDIWRIYGEYTANIQLDAEIVKNHVF